MQIASRFTIAVHTLLCIAKFADGNKVTSDFISSSTNVNSVIIRRTLGSLKKAGLVDMVRGSGGAFLTKKAQDITLLDIYKAVDCVEESNLFNFHNNPNPECPVGKNIHNILDSHLTETQRALENSLNEVKLSQLLEKIELLNN